MTDEVSRRSSMPDDIPAGDDDVEIIEVVGMDEDTPPRTAEAEPATVVSFDEDEAADDEVESGEESLDRPSPDRERMLRLQADFENLQNRLHRERDEFRHKAAAALLTRLLPVVDNLERALAHQANESSSQAFRDGVALIHRQLMEELAREGLRRVPAVGEPFDPKHHEAVATEQRSDCPPHVVLEEYQKGYLLKDRLLRPAMVKVSVEPDDHGGGRE